MRSAECVRLKDQQRKKVQQDEAAKQADKSTKTDYVRTRISTRELDGGI